MPYARKYNYKGIETLQANVLRILERDFPAELVFMFQETPSITLATPLSYLKAHKPDPLFPAIVVAPDEDDAIETDDESGLDEENILDITIVAPPSENTEQLVLDIQRYKRATVNILRSATKADLLLNVPNHTPATFDVRGGQYRWARVQNLYEWSVRSMKFIGSYEELTNG